MASLQNAVLLTPEIIWLPSVVHQMEGKKFSHTLISILFRSAHTVCDHTTFVFMKQ